ncbi:ABC transporter permease [Geminicoccus roseus]|uniref:ABC transporter permease n=1 Tax=Geminicoccus roseus TaxID=404900 RepID=UPI000427D694|nr:ABC transporter permease [Geminicoccus roseus]
MSQAMTDEMPESRGRERFLRVALPLLVAALLLSSCEAAVRYYEIPHYLVPSPSRVFAYLWTDFTSLVPSWLVTLQITFLALLFSVLGGGALALLFAQSPWIERAFLPYAVVLQVTPIVAVAPLIIIYVPSTYVALLLCAWIVAFFPILSNTTIGLHSADHNLVDLFQLYGASRWQTLLHLRLPSALPFFLAGLKVSGGLSLIAAVVAEYVAGTAGTGTGLAYRVLENSYRMNIPGMFACLLLLAFTGVAIFGLTSFISWLLLHRWHDSARARER